MHGLMVYCLPEGTALRTAAGMEACIRLVVAERCPKVAHVVVELADD